MSLKLFNDGQGHHQCQLSCTLLTHVVMYSHDHPQVCGTIFYARTVTGYESAFDSDILKFTLS